MLLAYFMRSPSLKRRQHIWTAWVEGGYLTLCSRPIKNTCVTGSISFCIFPFQGLSFCNPRPHCYICGINQCSVSCFQKCILGDFWWAKLPSRGGRSKKNLPLANYKSVGINLLMYNIFNEIFKQNTNFRREGKLREFNLFYVFLLEQMGGRSPLPLPNRPSRGGPPVVGQI